VAGTEESPVYAILKMKEALAGQKLPEGYTLQQYAATAPWSEDRYAMKWDGEWHITYEVFRDLGIAFAAVLVIIYILVVAWLPQFHHPRTHHDPHPPDPGGDPACPLGLRGFFHRHLHDRFHCPGGDCGAQFILLVDFIRMSWRETGDLRQAVIDAGAVRFRPIVLTAAAVVVGSFVMLFDPIFQGLAIAMMFGAVSATALTLVVVPLLYYAVFRNATGPGEAP
jgi:multidrug efflux pump subunit AcrB